MAILTKSDIKFDELRLFRQLQLDGTYKWFITVGYKVQTQEGEEYNRDRQIKLTGTQIVSASSFLANIYNQIKVEEKI